MSEPELTEEQIRALEAELERISVDDVVLQTVVSLINLGARKAGLAAPPGQAPEPDWPQTRKAIEAVRALLPLLEDAHGDKLGPVRDALSRLQLAFAQRAGAPGAGEGGPPPSSPGGERPGQGQPGQGPAQSSGRLWVPGQ